MDDVAAQVGRRLKNLRTRAGLTLSELARRSGVGKATLSQLETGRRNPTLETLYALTTALGTPLTAVLAPATSHPSVTGAAVHAVLLERVEDTAAVTELYRVHLPAGTTQDSPAHPPGTAEHLVVLTGTAEVGPRTAPVLVGPGEHADWAADVPHRYAAPNGPVEGVLTVRYPAAG